MPLDPARKKKPSPPRRAKAPKRWEIRPDRVIALKDAAPTVFSAEPKLLRIVESIGLSSAADVLGVDKSQLSRIVRGTEAISAEVTRRVTDVEYIIDRALQVMNPHEIGPWLNAPEPLLGDRLPLNVLAQNGPELVIRALNGIAAGVFA